MGNPIGPTSGIELPGLRKQTQIVIDVMRPGHGIPWEDRGSMGIAGAYFKTVFKSMFSPALLLDHISRPETSRDGYAFVAISISLWVLSVLGYKAYQFYQLYYGYVASAYDLENNTYFWMTSFIEALLVGLGVFAFVKVGMRIFIALAGDELKNVAHSLIFNCFAYSLGPSLLAVVPIYGWGLAGIWIVFNLVVAGKRRLYMKSSSAIINVILIAAISVAVGAAVYFLFPWFWNKTPLSGLTLNENMPSK